jgi:hypothetical protein
MRHHLKVEPSVGQGRRSRQQRCWACLGVGRALWTPAANNARNMSQINRPCVLIARYSGQSSRRNGRSCVGRLKSCQERINVGRNQ